MIRYALGPSLGSVLATRPAPPAADSPGDGDAPIAPAAKTLPEVSAAATAAHPDGETFCVGVAVRIHPHVAATSLRVVGLAAVFARPGETLPTAADELIASGLPTGRIDVDLACGPDGVVPEFSGSIDVLGLAEGRNDGQVVIAYDDEGYPPTTVEVPAIPA